MEREKCDDHVYSRIHNKEGSALVTVSPKDIGQTIGRNRALCLLKKTWLDGRSKTFWRENRLSFKSQMGHLCALSENLTDTVHFYNLL